MSAYRPIPFLLDPDEAAAHLGVSVEELEHIGGLQPITLGDKIRYDQNHLDRRAAYAAITPRLTITQLSPMEGNHV